MYKAVVQWLSRVNGVHAFAGFDNVGDATKVFEQLVDRLNKYKEFTNREDECFRFNCASGMYVLSLKEIAHAALQTIEEMEVCSKFRAQVRQNEDSMYKQLEEAANIKSEQGAENV